jgi:hypothetical protein
LQNGAYQEVDERHHRQSGSTRFVNQVQQISRPRLHPAAQGRDRAQHRFAGKARHGRTLGPSGEAPCTYLLQRADTGTPPDRAAGLVEHTEQSSRGGRQTGFVESHPMRGRGLAQ